MYTIKRGKKYFCQAVTHDFNGEKVRIITWTTDKNKAAKFTTPEIAMITDEAIKDTDVQITID